MEPEAPARRGWRQPTAVATVVATLSIAGGVASAGSGGGVGTPDPPRLDNFSCVERCADLKSATVGSRIAFEGKNLAQIDAVRFAGAAQSRLDPVPARASRTRVEATVPQGAGTGYVQLSGAGSSLRTSEQLEIVAADAIPDGGEFKLSSASAAPRKAFYDSRRKPEVDYVFRGGSSTNVRIEVVNRKSKETVASIIDRGAEPNAQNTVKWNGKSDAGRPVPSGKYKFKLGSIAGGLETTADSGFGYYGYRFPVAGKHDYGDGFGAGRNHQGQDVFASCGTPLRASRGGRVQWNKTHSAAGNYLVIDLKGSGVDHMYAHLLERSTLAEGDRVRTGEVIGRVGESGNASGCHLHFEIWSAPGWYEGGQALSSVTRQLKAWDGWS